VAAREHAIAATAGVVFMGLTWAWTQRRRDRASEADSSARPGAGTASRQRLKSEVDARST
jgi:hypothetical protein